MIGSPSVNATGNNSSSVGNTSMSSLTSSRSPSKPENMTTRNITVSDDNPQNYTFHKKDSFTIPEIRTDFLGFMDTVFVWFRYIHFTIVPMIIFAIHKVNVEESFILEVV